MCAHWNIHLTNSPVIVLNTVGATETTSSFAIRIAENVSVCTVCLVWRVTVCLHRCTAYIGFYPVQLKLTVSKTIFMEIILNQFNLILTLTISRKRLLLAWMQLFVLRSVCLLITESNFDEWIRVRTNFSIDSIWIDLSSAKRFTVSPSTNQNPNWRNIRSRIQRLARWFVYGLKIQSKQ